MSYWQLRRISDERAARANLSDSHAVMQTMTFGVLALMAQLPIELRPAAFAAGTRWLTLEGEHIRLANFRVQAWQFLDRKNGDSTSIHDHVDVAVRALLCTLWDEETESSVDEMLEYYSELLSSHEGVAAVLGI